MSIASRINEMTEHLKNNWNSINKLGLKTKKLPDEYKQVEYIESSGTQYIDTGVNSDSNLRVKIDMAYTVLSPVNNTNFGAIRSGSPNIRYHFMVQGTPSFRIYTMDTGIDLLDADTNRHIFDLNVPNNIITVDDAQFNKISTAFDTQLNFWLFRRNSNNDSYKFYNSSKLYSCQMYYNNELVRDFVPCYRNSDNEIGLYDTINDMFYTNQGTGIFTYGETQEEILNKNIKNITPVLDRFYNQLSDKTNLSESGIVGKTSQESTTGKNLLNVNANTYLKNGITSSTLNQTIIFNGTTSDGWTNSDFNDCFLKANEDYIFSISNSNAPSEVNFKIWGYKDESSSLSINVNANVTFTPSTNITKIKIVCEQMTANKNYDIEIKCQIEKGSTATSYEPCTGGEPSPSPDYQQEPNNLSGDVEYKVRGKNKLPFPYTETSHTHNGITYTINNDGTVLVNGTATAQSNTKLYGNYQESNNKESIGKYLYGGTNEVSIRALNHTGDSYTVLATDTGNGTEINTSVYKKYYIEICVLQGVTVNNVLIKPMVLDSLDDLKYESYVSENFPLSLKSKNLFDKNNEIVSGKGFTQTGEIANDGSLFLQESYIKVKPNSEYTFSSKNNDYFRMCEYDINKTFIQRRIASNNTAAISYTTTSTTEYIRVSCNNTNLSTLQIEKVDNLFVGYDNMQSGFLPQSGSYPTTNSSYPNAKYQLIELKQGESVITSGSTSPSGRIRCIDKSTNKVVGTITNAENNYYTSTSIYTSNFASGTITAKKDIMLGVMILTSTFSDNFIISKISSYEPYYDIELCNIDTYEDKIYSNNGRFYLEKKIEKHLFTTSDVIEKGGSSTDDYARCGWGLYSKIAVADFDKILVKCNKFLGMPQNSNTTSLTGEHWYCSLSNTDNFKIMFRCGNTEYTRDTFPEFIKNNGIIVYYPLRNHTTTEITQENYPTLYSQLLAIQEFLTKYKINKEFLLNYSSLEIFLNDEIQNPPSESEIDWSTIGYDGTPQAIKVGYDYAKSIYDSWDNTITSMASKYNGNREIMIMPLVDTSNVTNMTSCFYSAHSFSIMPSLNTSKVTNMQQTFRECRALQVVPLLNTSKVTTMQNMFANCYSLKTVPLFDTSSINSSTSFSGMFSNCIKLTDESLDNILQMCVNATGYPGTKTLYAMGFINQSVFPVSRIEALPHYQDFIDAGWTIGY